MNFIHLIKKKTLALIIALFAATFVMAQGGDASGTVKSENNQVAVLLIIMTLVLAFVIWGLGQVLIALSRQLVEKSKKSTNITTTILLIIFILAAQSVFAQDTATKEVVEAAPNYGGLSAYSFYMFVSVIVAEIIAILFLTLSINRINAELSPSKQKAVSSADSTSTFQVWWSRLDKKIFTKAIPVEREADIMLDHDYDGIRELDNALPPWWKYGFYITIVVGVIYLFNFHVFGSGKNPTEEYLAEMEQAKIENEIYESKNKDKIDENNVPMADATGLTVAKNLFAAKCLACHGVDGGGGAGPNLTDDYWIHKGALNDIYKSIKLGYPDKGMQSWSSVYTPKEMSYLSSYIKTMRGTKPQNPKAPQGDLFTEDGAAQADKDSTKSAITDTTAKSLSKK